MSDDNYVPSTDFVRDHWIGWFEEGESFDRWLDTIRAEAWDEGAQAATEGDWRSPLQGNPYGGPNA